MAKKYEPQSKSNSTKTKKERTPAQKALFYIGTAFMMLFRFIIIIGCIGAMAVSVVAVLVSLYVVDVTADDNRLLDLGSLKLSFTTIIFAKNTETQKFEEYQRLVGDENRIWVDLPNIGQNVKDAFIATEDDTFYEHVGVNFKRTVAAVVNEYVMDIFPTRQGASTITQQLIKNITGDEEQDAMRKVREIFRAIALENRYSKEVILEAYLNTLRLSGNIAGVQAGSNIYFGKSADQLTLAEAASIAGITKSPYEFDPYVNPEKHLKRRNDVLYFMREKGFITELEYQKALKAPLGLVERTSEEKAKEIYNYFVDQVIGEVIVDLKKQKDMTQNEASNYLFNGGLRIYCTVIPELQEAMEKTLLEGAEYPKSIKKYKDEETGEEKEISPQAAMVSVNYQGEVVAIYGSLGVKTESRGLNRASGSLRQTGSTMKPIGAYALGIDYNHFTYSTGVMDTAYQKNVNAATGRITDWPQNYSRTYTSRPMTIVDAIRNSINTVAVRVLAAVGPKVSYDFLTNTLGITSLISETLIDGRVMSDIDLAPLGLGSMTYGISPLQMAGAYSIFGSGGKFTTLHSYSSIEDSTGEVIMEPVVTTIQAISPETAFVLNKALERVLVDGTARGLSPKRIPAVGKTGTTSDNKDHWFIGLTPYYCTASWWGYDEPVELNVSYSSHPPTTAWRNTMNVAQENLEFKAFPTSEKVVTAPYCTSSGNLASDGCPRQTGYYKESNLPPRCLGHAAAPAPPPEG